MAASLAGLPVLPRARQALEASFASRGAVAAQALAGGAVTLEWPGDGAVRAVQASPGPGLDGGGAGRVDVWEGVVAWGAARVRGGLDLSVLLALRDAFAGGEPRRAGPGHGRDAPAAGGDPHGVPPEDPAGPLIAAFVDWFNGPGPAGEEPAVRAALAHYHILSLRPLSERYAPAARLIETVLLDAAGFRSGSRLMAEYYLRHAGEYEATRPIHPALAGNGGERKNDPTRFVAFCLDALIFGLREVEERVAGMLRRVVLERHYEELRQARRVTARQHALLRLLLDGEAYPVGIRSLCRVSPYSLLYGRASEQTARRDLKRLSGMGLLAASGEGFVLNRCALSG